MNILEEKKQNKLKNFASEFVELALKVGAIKFGKFTLKSGRVSPYFFNAGLFDNGEKLSKLAKLYAQTILTNNLEFDMIFGPAYKGIILASAVAVELANSGKNVPFVYNRKEIKSHGEGGHLVGGKVQGKVLIVDDALSAGTAIKQSIEIIKSAGAIPSAAIIALDRQEKIEVNGIDINKSSVQYIEDLGLKVVSIANLDNFLEIIKNDAKLNLHLKDLLKYQENYAVKE